MKAALALLLPPLLVGCASALQTPCVPHPNGHGCLHPVQLGRGLPYDAWGLGFMAPPHMAVWVEDVVVHDLRDRRFGNLAPGTAAMGLSGDPAGWTNRPGPGKGRDVIGADLPKRVQVRWQSLVEPQTYEATLEIPDDVRALMLTQAPSVLDPNQNGYRNRLVVGLAPGGAIKVWVSGTRADPVEMMCAQASVVAEGPDGGRYGGRYVTLPERARAFVEANPIPYGSWACGVE